MQAGTLLSVCSALGSVLGLGMQLRSCPCTLTLEVEETQDEGESNRMGLCQTEGTVVLNHQHRIL